MKGANFIIGYVKGGNAEAFDHYGITENKHKDDEKLDGQDRFLQSIRLRTGWSDRAGVQRPPGLGRFHGQTVERSKSDTIVLLAYGRSDSIVLKHRFRAILKVNLSSGEHSVLKMK